MKIAIYLRVSTDTQTTDSQSVELAEYCQRRGWANPRIFQDVCSGAKKDRTGLEAMMKEVRRGKLDVILGYKLDRIGRSLSHLAQLIGELTVHRVALVIPAQGIDTTASNPASALQLNILMAVAEFEREILRERVMSGLKAARARGSRLGRPDKLKTLLPQALPLVAAGLTVAALARELKLPYSSAHKLAGMAKAQPDGSTSQ